MTHSRSAGPRRRTRAALSILTVGVILSFGSSSAEASLVSGGLCYANAFTVMLDKGNTLKDAFDGALLLCGNDPPTPKTTPIA